MNTAQPSTVEYLREHRAAIDEAAARISPHVRRTPTLRTDRDPRLSLKCECFQVTGSFKPRGAFNAILKLAETSPRPPGVLAVSSGNHAQAVALAARSVGLHAVIVIPEDANPQKVAATRALGAEVINEGVDFANREAVAREIQQARELAFIHPFDNWDVIHGQGTASLELLEDSGSLASVACPIGGGGLTCGTALAMKAQNPDIRVIGVEPQAADDAFQTWSTGSLATLPSPPSTLADGVRTVSIGTRNFEVMVERRLIDGIVTVSEVELKEAVLTAWTRLKLALEPTAALPLAAYLTGKLDRFQNEPPAGGAATIGLILSGGNFDSSLVARLLADDRGQGRNDTRGDLVS